MRTSLLLLAPALRCAFLTASLAPVLACSGEVQLETPPADTTPLACVAGLSPRPWPALSPGALCDPAADLPGPSLLALVGLDLQGVRPGGAQVLHSFFSEPQSPAWKTTRGAVLARGRYVAAALAARPDGAQPGDPVSIEIALLDIAGTLLHRHRLDLPYSATANTLSIVGNDRGVFAVGYRFGDAMATQVITVDGARRGPFDGFLPVTDPDERGYLALQDERDLPARPLSWLDPCTGERTPARKNGASVGGAMPLGPEIVYFDVGMNALVREGAASEEQTPLDPDVAFWLDAHPSGWVLFATKDPARLIAVHARTFEVHPFSIVIPKGLRRYDAIPGPGFDGAAREIHVTSAGGLALPLRDDAAGRLYVTGDGKEWQALGAPIGEVYRAYAAEAGGTYLHFGDDFAITLPAWGPPPAGEARLDGTSLQLLRPPAGVAAPIKASKTRYVHLSQDGGCAAYAIGGALESASAVTGLGASVALTKDDYWSVYATFTWAGGDDLSFLPQ